MVEWREKWIPRFFMAAMIPSFAVLVALVWFPQSELAKCPVLVPSTHAPTRVNESSFSFNINGAFFDVMNSVVFSDQDLGKGKVLIMLGIVLDVKSGESFYGPNGGYHALACGKDATRALLLSSLDEADMVADISDLAKGELRPKLKQWLSFFLNKYPQLGVIEGPYWTAAGEPTTTLREFAELIAPEPEYAAPDPVKVAMEPCERFNGKVTCLSSELRPKIKRQRGNSECVCVNENEIFSIKTEAFTVIHFEDCEENDRVCIPKDFEL